VLPIGEIGSEDGRHERLRWDAWRPTLVAAILATAAVAILIAAVDSVSAYERPVVVASLSGSVIWIAAAIIGSCSTIAALMLTAISLLDRLETRHMRPRVLFHIRLVVLGALAAIAFAVGTLLLTTFPVAGGVDVEPPQWHIDAVFFGLLALTALTVGAFAVVLTSLYATIADVLRSLPGDWVEEILAEDEDEAREAQRKRAGSNDASHLA
jgi:hypothetical protein